MENYFQYLTEAKNADEWGISVPTCGYQHIFPGDSYPPEGHPDSHSFNLDSGRILNDCHILYIPTGSGKLITASQEWDINSGDIIVLAPGKWHNYQPHENTGWEEYWIGFNGNYISNYIMRELIPHGTSYVKHLGFQDELIYLFNQSLGLIKKNSLGFQKILAGIVLQLVAYVVSHENIKVESRNGKIVRQTINHIKKNLKHEIDFRSLSNELNLSYNRFRSIFKGETGLSLQQYVIHERLENAKRMMINTDLSLKEISARTGFRSQYYFSKIFKIKVGYSPSKARR